MKEERVTMKNMAERKIRHDFYDIPIYYKTKNSDIAIFWCAGIMNNDTIIVRGRIDTEIMYITLSEQPLYYLYDNDYELGYYELNGDL